MNQRDDEAMGLALAEGERARLHSPPNPWVGAVIVDRDGVVVGQGHTQPPGAAHAEIEALRHAGERARGATIYVTLEPCAHVGRTGACTDALIAAFARVLLNEAQTWQNGLAGRLSGADFALLVPGQQLDIDLFEQLYHKLLAAVSPALPGVTSTWLVGAAFAPDASPSSLLAQLDEVLASLEAKHQNGWQWLALPAEYSRPLSQQQRVIP
mgnify:CR=1 FL=1